MDSGGFRWIPVDSGVAEADETCAASEEEGRLRGRSEVLPSAADSKIRHRPYFLEMIIAVNFYPFICIIRAGLNALIH